MKKIVDGIIVVEGKTDVSVLSSFLDAEYVITNGSAIDNDVLNYLLSSKLVSSTVSGLLLSINGKALAS